MLGAALCAMGLILTAPKAHVLLAHSLRGLSEVVESFRGGAWRVVLRIWALPWKGSVGIWSLPILLLGHERFCSFVLPGVPALPQARSHRTNLHGLKPSKAISHNKPLVFRT